MNDFALIVRTVRCRHRIRVRKWRSAMSGSAWQVFYENGRTLRWIESPFPKSAISLAIFLHEVGHHVIGFDRYTDSCEEEFHAWQWAMREMARLGIKPDDRVLRRYRRSMEYAVSKALRRGIKPASEDLRQFMPRAA